MTTDLQLAIDARAAEAGKAKFVGALNSIKAALEGMERASDGAFTTLRKGMQVTPNKSADAVKQTADAVKRLQTASKNALTSASKNNARVIKQLRQVGDTSGITKAEQAYAKLQARMDSAKNSADLGLAKADYRAQVSGLESEAKARTEAALAATKQAAANENLRKRHDELFAVSKRYEASLEEIAHLERTGALTAEKATAARARATQQLTAGAVATGKYGQALRVSHHNVANFSNEIADLTRSSRRFDMRGVMMQLSQVGQQGQVTGNYLAALMVQLPDLALGFGPYGIAAGAVAGILGTTLVSAMSKTSEESEKMRNQVHELSTALDGLEQNSAASASQIEAHLKKAFGSVAGDVQSLIEDLREAEFGVLSHQMRKEVEKATTELTSLGGAFEIVMRDFLDPGKIDSGYVKQMQEIVNSGKLTFDQFSQLESAVQKVFTSRDVNDFVEHLATARSIAEDIGGPVGNDIGAALLKAAENAGILNRVTSDAATSTKNLSNELSDGAKSVLELNKIDMSKGLSDATLQAAELAAQLNISLNAANALQNVRDSKVYGGRGGDPRRFGNSYTPPSLTKPKKIRSGGGGGAGRVDDITRVTRSLEEQNRVYELLASGVVQTETAARLLAQAQLDGTIDATKESAILAADAMAQANEQLEKMVNSSNSGLNQAAASGLKDGLKQGFQQALDGDGANFAKTLANSVKARMADTLSDKVIDTLGIDNLFNIGGHSAAAQMQAGIIQGSAQGASMMAQAISTGQAASAATGGGGGNWLTTAARFGASLFGIPAFKEGGYSDAPNKWANAPQYAEGTANTSNGIPAVLHPNEAVVPLSRGRKIPVEMGDSGKGTVTNTFHTEINVDGSNDDDATLATKIAQRFEESVVGLIDTKIAESAQYGGVLNPRGGR